MHGLFSTTAHALAEFPTQRPPERAVARLRARAGVRDNNKADKNTTATAENTSDYRDIMGRGNVFNRQKDVLSEMAPNILLHMIQLMRS